LQVFLKFKIGTGTASLQIRPAGAAQAVEHLSSKHEALSSNPSAAKNKIKIRATEQRNIFYLLWEEL
jgi:hypothetical protein